MDYRAALRWEETKLTSDTKPKVRYEYFVTGRGAFAYDMLRHDCAWPATGDDAQKMFVHPAGAIHRSIKMRSYQKPEIDRWASFGWTVSKYDLALT
jgi:hypothetical protein